MVKHIFNITCFNLSDVRVILLNANGYDRFTKQEAIFTDNTGSIRVVLWAKDIPRVTTGTCYNIKNIAVKEYGETKYLTPTRHSTIESVQINIDQQDTSDVKTETTQCQFPPDGVNYGNNFSRPTSASQNL